MERRSFLRLFCVGIGAMSIAEPANALEMFAPLAVDDPKSAEMLSKGVATSKDMDEVRVEEAWYGHWRRVNRRHYRRVSRRVYRRHYYY
jgi:hypothetical protein